MKNRWLTMLAFGMWSSSFGWALPQGGQVVQGTVQIIQSGTNVMQILQSSPSGIINWGSFNIDPNQLVRFLQPDSSAALLNRVVGQDPSQILGQLQANGRILLVNPNGMLFGPGSSINAGSFLASTLSLRDEDFLQGRYDLHWDGQAPLRAIVNQGEIKVTDGGFLALVSPLVDNQGLLLAERGQVVIGATRQATLTVDSRGLLQVTIPDGFASHSSNSAAPSGTVLLTPGQMSDTLSQLVRPAAGAESTRMVETPQGIQLLGGEGILLNQGTISADAAQGGAGSIRLDSSQATVLTPQSLVRANAAHGDGGQILALSAGSTLQMGQLQARSEGSGNGGFVEVSGRAVHMTRGADVAAAEGASGRFLIDPDNITIVTSGGSVPGPNITLAEFPATDVSINASALNVTGSVILQASQNLVVDDNVQVNLEGSTQLSLEAGGEFRMQPGSAINATHPAASVNISSGGQLTVRDLRVPTSNLHSDTFVQFQNGTLGQAGSPTVVNVTAGGIPIFSGATVNIQGTQANVSLAATNDVFFFPDSTFNLTSPQSHLAVTGNSTSMLGVVLGTNATIRSSGAANVILEAPGSGIVTGISLFPGSGIHVPGPGSVNITAQGNLVMNPGSTVNMTDPTAQANLSSGIALTTTNLQVPNATLQAAGDLVLDSGTLGQGGPTVIAGTGANVFFLNNAAVSGAGATRLTLSANTGRVIFLTNSSLSLPDSGSNITLNSVGTMNLNRIQTGGSVNGTVTAGNLRISDQVQANDLRLSTPQELSSLQNSTQPAVVANHTLDLTAGRILGPIDQPENGIVQAFPFATSSLAIVRFQVTGTNNTATGDRAANLFYYFPQSADLQIDHPNGDVALFQEPGPVVPAPPPTDSGSSSQIESRDDLTSEQFVEVTSETAISQIQMSNLYSAAYLPSTTQVLMLSYANPGLTGSPAMSPGSAMVELVVLSPESASSRMAQEEQLGADATSLVVAGNDEDEELRYWRKLIEGFIIWEDD